MTLISVSIHLVALAIVAGLAIIGYAWGTGNTDRGRYRLVKVGGT